MGKICTVFYSKSSTQIVKDITFLILFRKVSDTSMTDQFFQEKELVLRHGKNSNPFFLGGLSENNLKYDNTPH